MVKKMSIRLGDETPTKKHRIVNPSEKGYFKMLEDAYFDPMYLQLGSRYSSFYQGNAAIDFRKQCIQDGSYFIGLDIDECSIVGQDSNDIAMITIQAKLFHQSKTLEVFKDSFDIDRFNYMQLSSDRLKEQIELIAQATVNPELVRAYHIINTKLGHKPYIFLYTQKGTIAKMLNEDYKKMEWWNNWFKQDLTRLKSDENVRKLETWNATTDAKKRLHEFDNGYCVFF